MLLGRARLEVGGRIKTPRCIAIPANTPHTVHALEDPVAGVAYLDARRYRFEDAQRLARRWQGFVPGRDDLREALGDALEVPRRRIDPRLLQVLDAMDEDDLSLVEAAGRVDLSPSRVTHLMTDTLGAPPRAWRTWFRLCRAIHSAVFSRVQPH